ENRGRIVRVHERARAVVDGLAAYAHVVRVHDAVDEADQLPADDQVGLQVDDPPEQLQIPVGVLQVDVGEMPLQRVVGQRAQVVFRGQVRGKLKRADTDVARSDAGQHRAGQRPFPKNPL